MQMTDQTFGALILLLIVGFLPLAAVTVTAFAKIAVVLSLVRNALGVQQLPPNIVIYTLSIILAAFIAMPMMTEAYNSIVAADITFSGIDEWFTAGKLALKPLTAFLSEHTDPKQLAFFKASAEKIWEHKGGFTGTEDSITILAPAFLLTELTRAFEIGFLLYLPFVAIDIIVTVVLMALGMMMVSPTILSVPFKLMLFIFVDGWSKLIHGLILTYM